MIEVRTDHYILYATEGPVQIVTYRVTAHTPIAKAGAPGAKAGPAMTGPALAGERRVHFRERNGFVDCPIYDRARLAPEQEVAGPAILEQMDTTTVVLPGQRARVQRDGSLLLTFA